jgi:hypothetical protein
VASALTVAAPTAVAGALSTSQQPPDLQRVLAAERFLNVNHYTARISVSERRGSGSSIVSKTVGVGHTSPEQLSIDASGGGQAVDALVTSTYVYATYPGLSRIDGGYEWVRAPAPTVAGTSLIAVARAEVIDGPALAVATASKVRELARTTVDGQSVYDFLATGSAGSVRMFIASDGLLVRGVQTTGAKTTTTDVSLSASPPVSTPPASETVDESSLSTSVSDQVNSVVNQALSP